MLMTGVDHHTAGVGNLDIALIPELAELPGYEGHLTDRVATIASRLRRVGYRTYIAGKWHLGVESGQLPIDRGFDRSLILSGAGGDNFEQKGHAAYDKDPLYFDGGERYTLPPGFFSTTGYTDRLIEDLDRDRDSGRPFFAYLSYQAVHHPHQAPPEYIERYAETYDEGWDVLRRRRYERMVELELMPAGLELLPGRAPRWDELPEEERRYRARQMAVYAAMLEHMDASIGRVLDHLRATGEHENTVIVFLSDNGADNNRQRRNFPEFFEDDFDLSFENLGGRGSHSSYGPGWATVSGGPLSSYKGSSAEGGMRVPLIVSYPKSLPKARRSDAFVWATDIPTTLLDLGGADLDDHAFADRAAVQGRSLLPLLIGAAEVVHPEDEPTAYELAGSAAVFRGRFKARRLHAPFGDRQWQLFDLVSDPTESEDLAAARPELLAELLAAYREYEQRVGVAPLPADYNPIREILARGRARREAHP